MLHHQDIAERMNLFQIDPAGPGMIFWRPEGYRLFRKIENYVRRIYELDDFYEVKTPQLLKKNLWEVSGHWEKFSENMFTAGEWEQSAEFALKPMSCPAHILIFKRGVYSYRNLPMRIFEFGVVHRNEPSGALNGCLRLRQFTQDDAHTFCQWEQAEQEVMVFLQRAKRVYGAFGYEHLSLKISTMPASALGSEAEWLKAQKLLATACDKSDLKFDYQVGEGAFYGPKIEIALTDAKGREWQCGTIQLDFNLPGRFNATFVQEDGSYQRPVILHQAILGSLERWIGILLEVTGGHLPLWIHPSPMTVLSVNSETIPYAQSLVDELKRLGIIADVEFGKDSLSRKLKRMHQRYCPMAWVIGNEEMNNGKITIEDMRSKSRRVIERNELLNELQQLDLILVNQ